MTSRTSPTAPSWFCHDRTVSPGLRSHSCKSAMDEAYTDDETKTDPCGEAKTGHCGEAKTGHCGEAKTRHCAPVPASSFQLLASGFRLQVSGFRLPASGFWLRLQASGSGFRR